MNKFFLADFVFLLAILQGCTGITTFPSIARPGDSLAIMLGGSEQVNKDNIDVTLIQGASSWDLADPNGDLDRSDSMIRSVFEVRTDGRAEGLIYNNPSTMTQIWTFGHEPVQSIMIVDLPTDVLPGAAQLNVTINTPDNASGVNLNFNIDLTVVDIPGSTGASDPFDMRTVLGTVGANLGDLEPAPHAKISFTPLNKLVYAVSIEIDFNEIVVAPDDLHVYIPEAIVGGSLGANQRMAIWHQDGDRLYIDIIAPGGIQSRYLKIYVMHPSSVTLDPGFMLGSIIFYDQDGNDVTSTIGLTSDFQYFQ